MKKALVLGTEIVDVVDAGGEWPVAEQFKWVDVPDDTTRRDSFVNGAVVKPKEKQKTYSELRLEAYRLRGATETACIEAIIEFIAGKPEKMNALAEIRDSVKRDFPKA